MQEPAEGPPVVEVEDGVDEGVEGAVDVAQPGDEVDESLGGTAAQAERQDDVHEEEGQPADDEDAHDDAEGAGRAALLRQRDPLALLDELVDGRGGGRAGAPAPRVPGARAARRGA